MRPLICCSQCMSLLPVDPSMHCSSFMVPSSACAGAVFLPLVTRPCQPVSFLHCSFLLVLGLCAQCLPFGLVSTSTFAPVSSPRTILVLTPISPPRSISLSLYMSCLWSLGNFLRLVTVYTSFTSKATSYGRCRTMIPSPKLESDDSFYC